jgi:hypothetical protein
MDLDSLDLQTVVEDNVHISSDMTIVGWLNCKLRDLHIYSKPEYYCFHAA